MSGADQTILVTGAGGGVGQSILKCFQNSPYRLVALDSDPHATGLYAATRGRIVPRADHPEYIDALLRIAREERAEILFPGLDQELQALAQAKPRFDAIGVTVVVSDPVVVSIADDKLATNEFLRRAGIPAPRTELLVGAPMSGLKPPFVIKPRMGGHRSKGVHVAWDQEEAAAVLRTIEPRDYVAQEYLDGLEYTCGIVNVGGSSTGPIVMRRTLRDGDTHRAIVVREPAIESTVFRAARALQPFGACNFQLRVVEGVPYIFEVNARCSGTTGARALAGFNEPRMIADFILLGEPPRPEIREAAILRYWNELVVPMERIKEVEADGVSDGTGLVLWCD